MEKPLRNKKKIIIILSILVTIALSIKLDIVEININAGNNWFSNVLLFIRKSISIDNFKAIVTFLCMYCLLSKTNNIEYKSKRNIFKVILAILFAVFTVFGYSYYKTNSWNLIFLNIYQFCKAFIVLIGYYIFFKAIITYFFDKIIEKIKYRASNNNIYNFIFEKHPIIIPMILIIIAWMPYLIIYYPGTLCSDSESQLMQYYGYDLPETTSSNSTLLIDDNVKITNHHPVLHTLILGTCTQIGKLINNDNLGVFVYTLLQTITVAFTLAYIINYMKKIKTNKWIRIISLIFFALMPVFPFSAIGITKDMPFFCFVTLYLIELYDCIRLHKDQKIAKGKLAKIIIFAILTCLFRNNGIYTVILSLPFLAIINKANRKKFLISAVMILILYEAFVKFLLPVVFKIPNSGIREMLSVPFQQTARYVKKYGDEIVTKDKEIIDTVLDYNTLATRYNPVRSDSVKIKYNKKATSDELKDYFRVWFKQLFKHPDVYIESFINNYYGYLYLESNPIEYTLGYTIDSQEYIKKIGVLDYSYNDNFIEARKIANEILELSKNMPIISLTTNIALSNWLILAMITYLLYKKKYRGIVFFIPVLANTLICFVSPVNAYFRYAMPNIFAMPLIIGVFLNIINTDVEGEINGRKEDSSINTML